MLYPRNNVAVEDIVLVSTGNTARNSLPFGRVEDFFFSRQKKVKSAILERVVIKLDLLVVGENQTIIKARLERTFCRRFY